MALIYLVSALALGAALTRRVPFPLYRFEAVAISVVLGLFGWTWLLLLLSIVFPFGISIPIAITVAAALTVWLWPGGRPTTEPLEGRRAPWVWGVATLLSGALVVQLFWSHSLTHDAEGYWSYAASWADYGLHATIANHVAVASHLPSDMPIASGTRITYPFLIDFLSGVYIQGGAPLGSSFFWPGALLTLSICQLIIAVGLRLFGRIGVGVGGLALALTIGSAAGTWKFLGDWDRSGKGLFAFLGADPIDYSIFDKPMATVSNLLVDGILPQRAILFGLSAGLVAFIFLIAARERDEARLVWPAAIIVGFLPMAHAHSFIIGMALLLTAALDAAWRARAVPVAHLQALGVALLIALPQLLWQQLANGRGTGGKFFFGWQLPPGSGFFGVFPYWFANFGLIGIALIVMPFVLRRHRQVVWLVAMLVVLLVTQLYLFQPTAYDNLKLIWWVYIIGGFFIAYLAGELVRRSKLWIALLVPLGIFVMLPGVLAIVREYGVRYNFASPDDVAAAKWVRENTAPDAVFASVDRPNNPIATLAGRTLVAGYSGWLYNFNVAREDRNAAVAAAYAGNFDDPRLKQYDADYLLVPTTVDPGWTVDTAALAKRPVLWRNNSWSVYRLPSADPLS